MKKNIEIPRYLEMFLNNFIWYIKTKKGLIGTNKK
jgi:hypothetical protein